MKPTKENLDSLYKLADALIKCNSKSTMKRIEAISLTKNNGETIKALIDRVRVLERKEDLQNKILNFYIYQLQGHGVKTLTRKQVMERDLLKMELQELDECEDGGEQI